MFLDAPRGFRGPQLIADRIAMLDTADRNQPLRAWADDLSLRRGAVVPQFDPTDAGVDARVLLLLEAPGPMANSGNRRPGSGFISADNNDQTAETAWRARDAAGLHEGVLAWNVTPRYLGAVKPLLQRHRVNTEVFRDLLDRHSGIALVSPGELHDGTWMQA